MGNLLRAAWANMREPKYDFPSGRYYAGESIQARPAPQYQSWPQAPQPIGAPPYQMSMQPPPVWKSSSLWPQGVRSWPYDNVGPSYMGPHFVPQSLGAQINSDYDESWGGPQVAPSF